MKTNSNTTCKQCIGIYGGTFDPIHFGHLRPVFDVCEQLQLKQVRFIPSFIPPHRDKPSSSTQHRLSMIVHAIANNNKFILDQREIERQGYSYMFDTLVSLRKDFPDNSLCLIIGMDAFLSLNTWHRWDELLDYCHIIVTKRPDNHFQQPEKWNALLQELYNQHVITDAAYLKNTNHGKIYFIEVTQLAISSSLIRDKLKRQLSIRYLLPDTVYDIIKDKKLYL